MNYDARQDICDYIWMLLSRICSIGSSGRFFMFKTNLEHDDCILPFNTVVYTLSSVWQVNSARPRLKSTICCDITVGIQNKELLLLNSSLRQGTEGSHQIFRELLTLCLNC